MMRSLRLMLLTLLTMVCGAVLAQEENSLTWNASSKDALSTVLVGNDLKLVWEEGGGDMAPKYSGDYVYFYNGNRVTVAGTDDAVKIQKIVFKFKDDTKNGLSTCDANGKNVSNTGITNDNAALTTTWTGEANSVTFRATQGTGVRYIESITVTYEGSAPVVEKAPVLAITTDGIADTYDMDANGVFVVYYENQGNLAAENAKLTLFVDGAENASKTIGTLNFGNSSQNFWNAKYNLEGLEAGEHQVKLALTADNADEVTVEKTVTFTKKAPEAAFTIAAQAVTVAYDAESYDVVATLTETNNVAATGVKVELRKGISEVLAIQTVDVAANGAQQVTLTVAKELFETGTKTYYLYVNDKYLSNVSVTFEEAPIVEVKDLAVTGISGSIDQAQNSNSLTVNVQNLGNVDITAATITLKAGETVLGTGSLFATVKAGDSNTGFSTISIAKEVVDALTAGELEVTATAEVDGEDADKLDNNTYTAIITVKAVPAPEATYTVTAENVTVAYGAENFDVVAKIKNTSEVDAANVAVKLLKGITEVETKTVATLAAGAEETVTFTVNEIGEAGKTVNYFVQVANKVQTEVEVIFEAAPVEEVKDLAITEVVGTIELANDNNNVRVSVKNNGTVDINDAAVTLKAGEKVLGTATVSAAAQGTGYCMVAVATEGLEAGELAVVATVEVEGDATPADNAMEATLTVNAVLAAEATFAVTAENVEVLTTDAKVKAVVNVKNTSEVAASQVEVKLLNGTEQIGESKWIFGLEAGAEQNVTFEFANFDKAGTYQIQAVAGKQSSFFDVIVKAPVAELAIESITGTINLNNTSSNVIVTVKNNGTANVSNAKATLSYGETTLESTISYIKAGETGYAYFQVPSEGLTAGELQVTAKVEYDETSVEQTATLTVTAADAPQATFSVTAENVTVAYGAEYFEIKATVKNTSEVAAENVAVKLLKGITEVATTNISELAGGAEQPVVFQIEPTEEAPFVAGTTATYYVQAPNAQAEVTVTFAKEATEEVKDLAIESIVGTIDLSATSSNVTVTVKNNGTVNVTNAKVTLTYGETTLEKTVSAKAGEQGYAFFQVASEGITGETLAVTAAVELEDDATPEDNTKTADLTVKAAPAAEPTFAVTADAVTIPFGAESFEIKATVKNTSEVAAADVVVRLLKGITEIETKTIESLAADAETEVTFTISEIDKTAKTYYVQVAGKAQAEVAVTYAEETTPDVIDMALTQVQGVSQINLKEENKVMVWYKNSGNVATTATIYASLNGSAFDTKTVENVKADAQNYVEFTLPTENLVAGENATFEATIMTQGDANAENNTIAKELPIVSGEAESQADIAINPISGWDVEAGEQTVNLSVGVFNNGEADANDVEINVYKSYPTILDTKTVSVKAGESTFVSFSFDYTFEQGKDYEFTVQTLLNDADVSNNTQKFTISCPAPVADVAVAKIADIAATTEDDVVIAATLKNNSAIVAENVLVYLYQGTEQVEGMLKKVNEIEANGEAQVEFNLGKLAAGNYSYNVMITSTDANLDNNVQSVSVKVTEYVAPVVNVGLTAIQGISNIDLNAESNTISVWVANEGNVDAEAAIAVTLNGTAVGEAQTVNVKAEKSAYATFTLPTEDLVAGETATVVATVTVADNTAETVSLTREYTIVDSSVATEPVFAVSAENVTVAHDATSFDIVATVKNTSTVDAENVEVKLTKGIEQIGEAQTIATLAAGAETTLTFTVNEVVAGTYYVNVANNKAIAEVIVTVEAEPVTPVVEVSLTQISLAGGQIDLAQEANIATVSVENTGNVDAEVTIGMTLNGTELEAQTITVKAEGNGLASFTLPTEGLVAGETATVVATVTVADNTAEKTTETKVYNIVDSSVAAEPTFAVAVENVTVPYGAENFNIVADVTNTSEVDAAKVEVRLLSGIEEEATQKIKTLAAGETKRVTFTLGEDYILEPGKTATYYVQVADQAQTEVTVTFEEAPVEQQIDLAVTSISGTLSVATENNYLTVFVENKGTVDVNGAVVKLTAGEEELGNATVSVKAGANGFCSIAVPATALQDEAIDITATVEAEGDVDETNNSLTKTFTVALPDAQVEISVADVTVAPETTSFTVPVVVKNLRENYAAKNVKVMIYDSVKLIGQATLETLAAGAEETLNVNIELTTAYTTDQKLRAWATGYSETQLVEFNLIIGTTDGIRAIMAQLGDNAQIYTVNGQKLDAITKPGMYIVNGRKVVVK